MGKVKKIFKTSKKNKIGLLLEKGKGEKIFKTTQIGPLLDKGMVNKRFYRVVGSCPPQTKMC